MGGGFEHEPADNYVAPESRQDRRAGSHSIADRRLRPLTAGIDFLGYVVYPTHTVVRRRVESHARARLAAWERAYVRAGTPTAAPRAREALRGMWASYAGHFAHAASYRLVARLTSRFRWLAAALTEHSV